MKKVICAVAAMLCFILVSNTARADVIWEPVDAFYKKHAEECRYEGREYTAEGPDGKVLLYKSPELPEVLETWENGYQVYIQFVYEDGDGILWGVYDNYDGLVGWVPMDYMELVYDSRAFREEYEEELEDRSGTLEDVAQGDEIYFWKYPGSREYTVMQVQRDAPDYEAVYVDGYGHSWGWVGYYYGFKDSWVCLDAPEAEFEKLYPDGAAEAAENGEKQGGENLDGKKPDDEKPDGENADQTGAGQETKRIVPKPDYGVMVLAVILVAAVTGGTAALLLVLKRSGKDTDLHK